IAEDGTDNTEAARATERADNRDDHPGFRLLLQLFVGAARRAPQHGPAAGRHGLTILTGPRWAIATGRSATGRNVATGRSATSGGAVATRRSAGGCTTS